MSTSECMEFTLQELLNLTLGAPNLTGTNTVILHSLLSLVLKKLNCQHEKVTITGYEAKQMEHLLNISSPPILLFDEKSTATTFKDLDKLEPLERCIADLESQLKQHLSEVNGSVTEPNELNQMPAYTACQPSSEESFSIMEPLERAVCEQLLLGDVAKLLIPRMMQPAVKAIKHIEQKLDVLEPDLNKLFERITELQNKLNLLDESSKHIEISGQMLVKMHAKLLKTLSEIRDILDSKIDTYEISGLVDIVYTRLENMWMAVSGMQGTQHCKRASSIAFERCGDTFDEAPKPPKFELPKLTLSHCEESSLLHRIEHINVDNVKENYLAAERSKRNSKLHKHIKTLFP